MWEAGKHRYGAWVTGGDGSVWGWGGGGGCYGWEKRGRGCVWKAPECLAQSQLRKMGRSEDRQLFDNPLLVIVIVHLRNKSFICSTGKSLE